APGDPDDARTGAAGGDRVAERLGAGGDDGCAVQGRDRDGGVVDDPVDDHLLDIAVDLDRVDGDLGHLPCQLALAGQVLVGAVDADVVVSHDADSCVVGGGVGWSVPVPCRWARAWWRWTVVAAAARSGAPAAIAREIAECSRAESASRPGELRARRRNRPRCRRSPRSDSAR